VNPAQVRSGDRAGARGACGAAPSRRRSDTHAHSCRGDAGVRAPWSGGRAVAIGRTRGSLQRAHGLLLLRQQGELFRAVLEASYLSLQEAERSVHLDDLEPAQALDEFCRFVWRYYLEHPEFIGLVNTENLHRASHLKQSPQLTELVAPIVGLLHGPTGAGREARHVPPGLDPTELYIAIAALGYFYLSNSATLSGSARGVSYVRRPAWTNIGVQARR